MPPNQSNPVTDIFVQCSWSTAMTDAAVENKNQNRVLKFLKMNSILMFLPFCSLGPLLGLLFNVVVPGGLNPQLRHWRGQRPEGSSEVSQCLIYNETNLFDLHRCYIMFLCIATHSEQ